jgi:acetyl esterase
MFFEETGLLNYMRMITTTALIMVGLLMTVVAANAGTLEALGTYEVIETDFVYATVGDLELKARSYRPKKEGVLPAAVDVHGGAWNLYDRTAGEYYNRALASSGLYVLAADFRQGPDFQHPLGSRDVAQAVRYLRQHAGDLSIDSGSIGLIGSSSGGHLALLAGIKPEADMHRSDQAVATERAVSAAVDYVVALWPVSDPLYRYHYAARVNRPRLRTMHEAYFGTESAMKDASIQRILNEGEAVEPLPAVMIVQPGEDENIPRAMTFDLISAWQDNNGPVDYLFYPSEAHAFGHRPSKASEDLVQAMHNFIARRLSQ